ncbi:MAG: SMC-Scp complex subunit ScpB [Chlorobiota bacterium]
MEIEDLPYFFTLPKEDQKRAIEALLFTIEEPVYINKLMKILATNDSGSKSDQDIIEYEMLEKIGFDREYIKRLIDEINEEYSHNDAAFRIIESGGGFNIVTSRKFGKIVGKINKNVRRRKLTNANLETLAIIAYRQPISRPGVESIRGVNSKEIINGLIDKGFVKIIGKSDAPGNPYLYGTTTEFLKSFGINSIDDLPKLKEIKEFGLNSEETEEFVLKIDEKKKDSEQIDN